MSVISSFKLPGMSVKDHRFELPLDYANPQDQTLSIFAREVVSIDKVNEDLPWLIFFQGGPGSGSPRPEPTMGWIKRAIQDYRVLLLDQRGTASSTPVTHETLTRFDSPQAQADYLKKFRADNIIRDAEAIRVQLLGEGQKWTALGQSYGGFCIMRYLSAAPEGLAGAIITAGLPPLERSADEVYRTTYQRVIDKNCLYYERYPEDVERLWEIAECLQERPADMPGGGVLTARRFQQLGFLFGMSDGFEKFHYLLDQPFVKTSAGKILSYQFLREIENIQHFETNPIFAILHEAIYAQQSATNWSAERVRSEFPMFELNRDQPIFFTGEMIYPWMFDDYEKLRPLKEAAHLLAECEDWPRLYDVDALSKNEIPVVAAVYANDMYVERTFSEETAKQIKGTKIWLTNEYEHNGLRADGERLLGRLIDILHGRI